MRLAMTGTMSRLAISSLAVHPIRSGPLGLLVVILEVLHT
jgi:hypothetical protein